MEDGGWRMEDGGLRIQVRVRNLLPFHSIEDLNYFLL